MGSPWVVAVQAIATSVLNRLLPAQRALRFVGPRFTLADNPTAVLNDASGAGQVTGCTDIGLADVGQVDTISGSAWIAIDSTDPAAPIVSIDPAPSAAADPDTIAARTADGDLVAVKLRPANGIEVPASGAFSISQVEAVSGNGASAEIFAQPAQQSGDHDGGALSLSGGAGHGTGADGGVSLAVGGSRVFEVYEEAALGGAKVARLGVVGAVAGFVIEETATNCEVLFYPKSAAGNGGNLNISGQDASNGNGGGVAIVGGTKGGVGTNDGKVVIGTGGVEYVKADAGLLTLGNVSNSSTASVKIAGPVSTTVGAAGGASPLPATPEKYITIRIQGTDYKLACYLV